MLSGPTRVQVRPEHPWFLIRSQSAHYGRGMTDTSTPPPADSPDIADALALLYDSYRRVHHADDAMARITAERLIQHLARPGAVLMRTEPAAAPPTAIMSSSRSSCRKVRMRRLNGH